MSFGLFKKNVIFFIFFYKYQERIFVYLKENFNFIPNIVHTDYVKVLYNIFQNKKIYENKILQGFCFFTI